MSNLVSIVIPTLNNLERLKDCISSIQNQSFKNYEVWIIDGNSVDGTKSYLQILDKPFYWVSQEDSGVYDAMNKGISLAKGDWLYFMGSDDKFFNNNILNEIFRKEISENQKLLVGKIKYDWNKNDANTLKRNDGIVNPSWSVKLWLKNTLPHQGLFYHRDLFRDRKYLLKYKVLADYDFNLYLFKKEIKIKTISEIVAICDVNGLSKKYNWSMYKEEINFKRDQSVFLIKPLFNIIGFLKYLLKSLKIL